MQNLSNYSSEQIITYPGNMNVNVTKSKAIFIIQKGVKANKTFKS